MKRTPKKDDLRRPSGPDDLENTKYARDTDLENTKYARDTDLESTKYARDTDLENTKYARDTDLENTKYARDTDLENTKYARTSPAPSARPALAWRRLVDAALEEALLSATATVDRAHPGLSPDARARLVTTVFEVGGRSAFEAHLHALERDTDG
jgi:hypothetical protein